ncbi:MAG: glycine cleavage system protein H [Gemmatimonadales bacterium]|jgi:glycine cleavage system H lipoate-binding protein
MGSTDIFATKGIEYLIVLVYLVLLLGFWRLLARPRHSRAGAASQASQARARGSFQVQDGFYYHQGHVWARPEAESIIRVGMDDFATRLLGKPGSVRLPAVGKRLRQGERGWAVEVGSQSIPVLSPVDGQVVAVNTAVLDSPNLLSAEPYDRGWLLKVRVRNGRARLKNLLTGKLARVWMTQDVAKVRQMQAGELGVVMPDGGIPIDGFVHLLAPDHWDQVAREFLLSDDK